MRARIDTGFVDLRAADLSLAFGLPRLPALGTHAVVLHGQEVELRLLGKSHQVVLGTWSETVACLPNRDDSLPGRDEQLVDGMLVQFASQTLQLDEVALADRVSGIVGDCAADEAALVGQFPGSPFAVTAMRAWEEKDGTAWRTWHSYPQAGELVETRTVVRKA